MAEKVIGVEPSVLDCLSWSETGDLAIAAGEYVELLIAKTRVGDALSEFWDVLHLRINDFNDSEVPAVSPAPFQTFSIGEEISSSEVAALDWSSQGLTKHRRCALGVLTQNRALSIWTPGSDPRSPYAWTRELVINRALDSYSVQQPLTDHPSPGSKTSSRFSRVRSFTWSSPALLRAAPSQKLELEPDRWGEHFLAVSNDNNDIVILWIPSHDSTSTTRGSNLKAEPMANFSLSSDNQLRLPDLSWTFEDYMHNSDSATHIAWSPWVRWQADNSLLAIIAYATREKLGFRQVNISVASDGRPKVQVGDHTAESLLPSPGALNGPLKWIPDISKNNRMQLLTSNGTAVLRYDVAAIGNIDIKRSVYIRNEWDPLAAFVCTTFPDENLQLQIPSHLSTTDNSTTTLDLTSFTPVNNNQNSDWKKKMLQHREVFRQEKHLGENVVIKTWGMSLLPSGTLLATIFSLHPTKTVEYSIPSDAFSILLVNCSFPKFDVNMFRAGTFSNSMFNAEILAFALKIYLSQQSDSERQSTIEQVLDSVEVFSPVSLATATSSPKSLVVKLREAFQTPAMKTQRLRHLVLMFGSLPDENVPDGEVDPQLISVTSPPMEQLISVAVLNISHNFAKSKDNTSTAIVKSYLKASLLHMRNTSGDANATPSSSTGPDEKCEICDADIPFESFTFAKCLEGHEFVRCALTFLAIQAPGISNFCGICSKQYLSEAYLDSDTVQQVNGDDDIEMVNGGNSTDECPSLARTLFAACDTCVYCGGRYVG